MKSRTKFLVGMALFSGAALVVGGGATTVRAQQQPGYQQPTAAPQAQDDITRSELANFDRFLDSHPDVGRQLAASPMLVTDPNFLRANPQLSDYLNQHPRVKDAITANPDQFMRREARFENSPADRDRDRDRDADRDRRPGDNGNGYDNRNANGNPNQNQNANGYDNRNGNGNGYNNGDNRATNPDDRTPYPRDDRDRPRPENGVNPPLNERELAATDQFLTDHPKIHQELEKKPELVNDQKYLEHHKELATFLNDHPVLKDQFRENPTLVIHHENAFARNEDNRDRDRNRQELANFDHFLDGHREIADQVRRNPSLVNDRDFVRNHPALQTYLQEHPAVSQSLRDNPNAFMQAENRYDRNEDNRGGDRDRQEFANFDRFLDSHREIGDQVRRNPSLVDDHNFVSSHPALQTYLQEHPQLRDQLRQDPNAFRQQEARNDRPYDADRDRRDDHFGFDHETNQRHFGEFLGEHPDVAQRLSEKPDLVKDHEFMDGHPELKSYLSQNPDVQKDLMANPENFVKSSQNYANPGAKSSEPAKVKP